MDQALIERDAAGREGGRLDLPITGMSCAACVRRVERAAAAVPGVRAVAVNLATERAAVTAAPGLRLSELAEALAKAGYPVVEETVDLAITGMSCASCVGRAERALMRLPGVLAAEVNLATERARVRVAAGAAGPGELAAAVEAAGYGAALPASAATIPGHEHDPPGGAGPGQPSRDGLAAAAACALAAPLVLPMLLMPFGADLALPAPAQFVLAGVVQLVFGARFYRGAWHALRAGTGSMDTLVALGTSAAFGLSAWQLLAGGGTMQSGHLYFEASGAVIALVRVGKWLEARARRQAGEAVRALERLRPERARVRRDGAEVEVPLAALHKGDLVVVRPGERIAADGLVREARAPRMKAC